MFEPPYTQWSINMLYKVKLKTFTLGATKTLVFENNYVYKSFSLTYYLTLHNT